METPIKACHNCRRRRVRCDSSVPVCQKCAKAGQECLGYGKLFIWNQGVASRGKMMGKTFQDMGRSAMKRPKNANNSSTRPTNPKRATEFVANASRTEATKFPIIQRSGSGSSSSIAVSAMYTLPQGQPQSMALSRLPSSRPVHFPALDVQGDVDEDDPVEISVHRVLVDPLYQDLDASSRYYISYFATTLCKDFVLYDTPALNPIRYLIPLTKSHPLLLHVLVAASAYHVFNLAHTPDRRRSFALIGSEPASGADNYPGPPISSSFSPATSYRDALLAKQRALRLLSHSLSTTEEADLDIILAAVVFFINFELIDSGKDNWRVHIDGAKRLINRLGSLNSTQGPAQEASAMALLRMSLMADCLVYDVLSSTLTRPGSTGVTFSHTVDLTTILKAAENNNYLSCPAVLLRILLTASQLAHSEDHNLEEQAKLLVQSAQQFDPLEWAAARQKSSPHEDLNSRLHVASAHKSAICIYISRILPLSTSNSNSNAHLATDIIHHLSFVPPDDPVFKSTCWPSFLAGAECEDMGQRAWVRQRLDELWEVLLWGYVRSAREVLEMIWQVKDTANEASGEQRNANWIVEVKRLGTDWLIV